MVEENKRKGVEEQSHDESRTPAVKAGASAQAGKARVSEPPDGSGGTLAVDDEVQAFSEPPDGSGGTSVVEDEVQGFSEPPDGSGGTIRKPVEAQALSEPPDGSGGT